MWLKLAEMKKCRGLRGWELVAEGNWLCSQPGRDAEWKPFPNAYNEGRAVPSVSVILSGLTFLSFISSALQILTGHESCSTMAVPSLHVSFWLSSWPRRGEGSRGQDGEL